MRKVTFLPLLSILVLVLSAVRGVALVQQQQDIRRKAAPSLTSNEDLALEEVQKELDTVFAEFPVYPNAQLLIYSSKYTLDGKIIYRASWSSSDSLVQIADYYVTALPEADWEIGEKPETTLDDNLDASIKAIKEESTVTVYIDTDFEEGEEPSLPTSIFITIEQGSEIL